MRHAPKFAAFAAAAVLSAATAQAQSPWLHVRVSDAHSKETVAVNLPLSVVEMVLEAAPEKIAEHGRIKISHHHHDGLSIAELRSVWKELSAAGDADLVSVEKEDETVHVGRRGDKIQVRVVKDDGGEEVRVDVPARLVDALLSGEGDELDLGAAFDVLKSIRGDIVTVRDDEDHVRIWIDDEAAS